MRLAILLIIPFITMLFFYFSEEIPAPTEAALLLIVMIMVIIMIFNEIDRSRTKEALDALHEESEGGRK